MSTYEVKVWEIDEIRHHPNADRLDIAKLGGWECIVGRDEHIPGELVIFIPPDSLVTDNFVDEFNITYLKGKGKNRIGAVKLRGEWSEGLIIPNKEGFHKDANVADFYKITKYEPIEPPLPRSDRRGRRGEKYMCAKHRMYSKVFPKYTKIENVKNYANILELGEPVLISEKVHGTSLRASRVPIQGSTLFRYIMKLFGRTHKFLVGSRNVILDNRIDKTTFYGDNVYSKVAHLWALEYRIPEDYILYGEIFGVNSNGKHIQKGYSYNRSGLDVRFFDVRYKQKYLPPIEALNFIRRLGLEYVPILYEGPWNLSLINEYTNKVSQLDEKTLREGFVVQPLVPRVDKNIGRVILKTLSPAYLAQLNRTERH